MIQEAIGHGGSGQVFRAWDQNLGRYVAIKRVRDNATIDACIRREAEILAALHHPNIVTIFDFDSDDTGPFVVMEYVEGRTLDEVAGEHPLAIPAFLDMANQVCRGLAAAHSRGLVHLDLKPGNIMFQRHDDGSSTCKILDFGLAHVAQDETSDEPDLPVACTPTTVAPEQLRREPLDARTDIYSLGCVFYFALSGKDAFQGNTVNDVINAHLYGHPVPLHLMAAGIPETLSHVIGKMMTRDPTGRPESVEDVRKLVHGAVRAPTANRPHTVTHAHAEPAAAPAVPSPGRRGVTLAAGISALLLLVAAAGVILYLHHAHPAVPSPVHPVAVEAVPVATPSYPVIDPLNADAVAQNNGQTVTMEGVVESVGESVLFHSRLLKFAGGGDDAAVVSVDNRELSVEAARAFVGKRIRATGRLSFAANIRRLVIDPVTDLRSSGSSAAVPESNPAAPAR